MNTLVLDQSGMQYLGVRELTFNEIDQVSGGIDAMDVAISWSSTVMGSAAGTIIAGGVRGMVFGGLVGFTLGVVAATGYHLATNGGGTSLKMTKIVRIY